jgi:hypothetical protein
MKLVSSQVKNNVSNIFTRMKRVRYDRDEFHQTYNLD